MTIKIRYACSGCNRKHTREFQKIEQITAQILCPSCGEIALPDPSLKQQVHKYQLEFPTGLNVQPQRFPGELQKPRKVFPPIAGFILDQRTWDFDQDDLFFPEGEK